VDYFSSANQEGIYLPELPDRKVFPQSILVGTCDNQMRREYTVVANDIDCASTENKFTIEGGKENIRIVRWTFGSYSASWLDKKRTFNSPPPPDLEPLLIAIIRLDEAIHLNLMNYQFT
jgi:hypothetical protein